jgi:hypothetical protein
MEQIMEMMAEIIATQKLMLAEMKANREEGMACQEVTEANPEKMELTPEMMQSTGEHREVPTEEATVKSLGTMKKWHRGRHLAAGQCGEPKELTRGDCGARRKLAATCRKMSHRAVVARCKRNVSRKIRTQGNCGPWKELAAASRKITCCAKVAQRKGRSLEGLSVEQGRRKNQTRNKFAEEPRKDGRSEGDN